MKKTIEALNYKELLGELAPYALTDHKKLFETIKDKDSFTVENEVYNYIEKEGVNFDCFVIDENIIDFLNLNENEYNYYFYLR